MTYKRLRPNPPVREKGACPYRAPKIWTEKKLEEEADALLAYIKAADKNTETVWYERFCFERGYSYEMMGYFCTKSEYFKEALRFAKSWQKSKLIEGGLDKKYHSSVVLRLLSYYYDIKEKPDEMQEVKGEVQIINYGEKVDPKPWKELELAKKTAHKDKDEDKDRDDPDQLLLEWT